MIKVLVVDDEVDITDSLVLYLESNGFQAYGAKNSKEAFEGLQRYNPDILILDINLMEEYTGIDVLKKAIELNPNAQAAMLTGLGDENANQESLNCGAKVILEKPIRLAEILEAVKELAKAVST